MHSLLFKVTNKHENELRKLGTLSNELGSYSSRRGVSSMIAGGCSASPLIISLWILAGWSMGGVKDYYLKHESAGDKYAGWCACCLNPLTFNFAISPLHFDFLDLNDMMQGIEKHKVIKN